MPEQLTDRRHRVILAGLCGSVLCNALLALLGGICCLGRIEKWKRFSKTQRA